MRSRILRDIGIDDDHMKEMGDRIKPGENLLFLLLHDINQLLFCREMKRFDGQLFESTASDFFDEALRLAIGDIEARDGEDVASEDQVRFGSWASIIVGKAKAIFRK